jgi:FdhD protein
MNRQDTINDPAILHLSVHKLGPGINLDEDDEVAVEEPLEIRLEYGRAGSRFEKAISITMRTPGPAAKEQDTELAVGFLFTEGILPAGSCIRSVDPSFNSIRIALHESVSPDLEMLDRHFYTSSSCGICGKSSIRALKKNLPSQRSWPGQGPDEIISAATLFCLPAKLRREQLIFDSTGGLHASALFDHEGHFLALREDIGRHNALDKLIGWAFREDLLPLSSQILLLSGRACFELVQKAAMAGIRTIAAIGPPSSLAVQLASDCGMTLAGFLRDQRVNLYTGAARVHQDS